MLAKGLLPQNHRRASAAWYICTCIIHAFFYPMLPLAGESYSTLTWEKEDYWANHSSVISFVCK